MGRREQGPHRGDARPARAEPGADRQWPGLEKADIWALDVERRAAIREVEDLRHRQRTVGEEIARRGRAKEDASALKDEMKGVAERIKALETLLAEVEAQIRQVLLLIPTSGGF